MVLPELRIIALSERGAETGEAWYDSTTARDEALARLPRVLVAPRAGDHPAGVELLDVPAALHRVNASAVRSGHPDAASWALPEAIASGLWPSRPT